MMNIPFIYHLFHLVAVNQKKQSFAKGLIALLFLWS